MRRGCIGITALELGNNLDKRESPPLDKSFISFERAKSEAEKLENEIKNNPDKYPKGCRVIIFSVRFWTNYNNKYLPDSDGRVDMSDYNYWARPADKIEPDGYIPFDYGLFDKKTNKWWHASQGGDEMKVFESSLKYYSKPLRNFNRQVFSVAISDLPLK